MQGLIHTKYLRICLTLQTWGGGTVVCVTLVHVSEEGNPLQNKKVRLQPMVINLNLCKYCSTMLNIDLYKNYACMSLNYKKNTW